MKGLKNNFYMRENVDMAGKKLKTKGELHERDYFEFKKKKQNEANKQKTTQHVA